MSPSTPRKASPLRACEEWQRPLTCRQPGCRSESVGRTPRGWRTNRSLSPPIAKQSVGVRFTDSARTGGEGSPALRGGASCEALWNAPHPHLPFHLRLPSPRQGGERLSGIAGELFRGGIGLRRGEGYEPLRGTSIRGGIVPGSSPLTGVRGSKRTVTPFVLLPGSPLNGVRTSYRGSASSSHPSDAPHRSNPCAISTPSESRTLRDTHQLHHPPDFVQGLSPKPSFCQCVGNPCTRAKCSVQGRPCTGPGVGTYCAIIN